MKRVVPCSPETAHRNTGYMVRRISLFGYGKTTPVMEETDAACAKYTSMGAAACRAAGWPDPQELIRVLKPKLVKVGIPGGHK